MDDSTKRIGGYGLGAVLIGGLCYIGFVREVEADAMTLLGAANVQLSLVHSFPETDKDGKPNEARHKLLVEVRDLITRARKQEPDLHSGYELEAHLCWASKEFGKAAELFRLAQQSQDATPESVIIDRLNEARMWRAGKQPEKARIVLEALSKFLVGHAVESQLQSAHVLLELGKKEEAANLADRIVGWTADARVLVDAGLLLESQNEIDRAAVAFRNAAETEPLANYYLARLKIRNQAFDTGLDLLKRAVAADSRRVEEMLAHDSSTWQPVHDDKRFKGLFSPDTEAAPPGR